MSIYSLKNNANKAPIKENRDLDYPGIGIFGNLMAKFVIHSEIPFVTILQIIAKIQLFSTLAHPLLVSLLNGRQFRQKMMA